jgi:hypothetical protein
MKAKRVQSPAADVVGPSCEVVVALIPVASLTLPVDLSLLVFLSDRQNCCNSGYLLFHMTCCAAVVVVSFLSVCPFLPLLYKERGYEIRV